MRPLTKLLALAVLLAAVSALYFGRYPDGNSTSGAANDLYSISAATNPTEGLGPSPPSSISPHWDEFAEHAAQPTNPAPDSLTSAYPELHDIPADWHQFNRETESLTVAPYPDLPLTFQKTGLKDEGNYVTWFGSNPGIPGSLLVAVATPGGGYHSVMITPGSSQFAFDTTPDGTTTVAESQPGEEGCALGGLTPDRSAAQTPTTAALFKAQYMAATASSPVAYSGYNGSPNEIAQGAPRANTNALQIGVLFLYDASTLAYAGSVDTIDGRSKAYIESGNVVLAQSLVTNFQWKYLGVIQAREFPEPASSSSDNASYYVNAISTGGAIGSWVATEAYKQGAAQVVLWLRDTKGFYYSGVAQTGGNGVAVWTSGLARAMAVWGSSYKVTIHELAHNFGCQHDRLNVGGGGLSVSEGNGYYCYGVLWRNNPEVTTYTLPAGTQRVDYPTGNITFIRPDKTEVYGWSKELSHGASMIGPTAPDGSFTLTNTRYQTASTIMGYGNSVIPYFSNPNITVNVTNSLAGTSNYENDWGTLPLGWPIVDPKAAYNAKILTDNAATIANLSALISKPSITIQPIQSMSLASGSPLTLNVTATGNDLAYQWFKDGQTINEATAANYTTTASSSTAGSYTVTVSNIAGSVTSNPAVITVSTANAPLPTSSGSGGSGGGSGGGGAPSQWFFGVLALLMIAHHAVCRRS